MRFQILLNTPCSLINLPSVNPHMHLYILHTHMFFACRCVLSRGGVAVAMSEDHKPDNPEETARVKKAGGDVVGGR
jgi:hypothetical protein